MQQTIVKEAPVVKQALKNIPSLVITMPFEPRLHPRKLLERYTAEIFEKAKDALTADPFSGDAAAVINRLYKQLNTLDYHSNKKSVAFFATRTIDRTFYLDIPLDETISINGSFHMRDLIYHKSKRKEFLVLVINKQWTNTFYGREHNIKLMKTDSPAHLYGYSTGRNPVQKSPSKGAVNDFLQLVASQFNLVSAAFRMPVFIIGKKEEVNRVYELINDKKNVIQLIYRDTTYLNISGVKSALRPFLRDWKTIWHTYLLQRVEDAKMKKTLVTGIQTIHRALHQSTPEILLIDENLYLPLAQDTEDEGLGDPFFINDRVDKLLASAIATRADIEFVKSGMLDGEEGIAMIRSSIPSKSQARFQQKDNSWMEIF